jgi:hypothetical protein
LPTYQIHNPRARQRAVRDALPRLAQDRRAVAATSAAGGVDANVHHARRLKRHALPHRHRAVKVADLGQRRAVERGHRHRRAAAAQLLIGKHVVLQDRADERLVVRVDPLGRRAAHVPALLLAAGGEARVARALDAVKAEHWRAVARRARDAVPRRAHGAAARRDADEPGRAHRQQHQDHAEHRARHKRKLVDDHQRLRAAAAQPLHRPSAHAVWRPAYDPRRLLGRPL